jgi:hypothetical protein
VAGNFQQRAETFGLESENPWALDALRLLCSVPRAYQDLVLGWEALYPGTQKALERLVGSGFVDHQDGVILDTVSGELAAKAGRAVVRWRLSAKGKRALSNYVEDVRTFEAEFPRTKGATVSSVLALLGSFDLTGSHSGYGMSVEHALALSGIEVRLGRWWVKRFVERGWLVELPLKLADVREVVPEHWRVTRRLMRQLDSVIGSFPSVPSSLRVELRLGRSRFLSDIDPARVGISGATDFDHDITTQKVVAAMLRSPRAQAGGQFAIEPRMVLPMDQHRIPWRFVGDGEATDRLMYQPDALVSSRDEDAGKAVNRRVIVEYERFQSRRDAWSHIERFIGWLMTRTLPFESATLCFVVDSEPRKRTYVQLIEAFCTHAMAHPELMVPNPTMLAVTTTTKILSSEDALNTREWSRISLPRASTDTVYGPVLHSPEDSPYDTYFGS